MVSGVFLSLLRSACTYGNVLLLRFFFIIFRLFQPFSNLFVLQITSTSHASHAHASKAGSVAGSKAGKKNGDLQERGTLDALGQAGPGAVSSKFGGDEVLGDVLV